MNHEDQIQNYLEDKLDTIARKRFEYALKNDKDLKKAFDEYVSKTDTDEDLTILPSKKHILKSLGFALILGIVGVGVSTYFQKNTPTVSPRIPVNEIYIRPDVSSAKTLNYSYLIEAYLKGDKSALDTLGIKARSSKSPKMKYWMAEMYFAEGKLDSMLTYLPPRFNSEQQDRVHYLEILGYYYLREDELVKQAIKRLPTSTDRKYLMVYNKLTQ